MENVKMAVEGKELVIRVNLEHRGELSSTKKSVRVASTEGNVEVPGFPAIKIGINAYTKPAG